MDHPLEQLDQQEQALFEQLDGLDEKQKNIIYSQLNEQQGERLQKLNSQLASLFEQSELSEEQEQKVNELFTQIEQMTNQAFERLTPEQQQKVTLLDEKIEGIYQQLYL